MENQILIGGQALRQLGHDRYTDDVDYLINEAGMPTFITGDDVDYINCSSNKFFAEIWANVKPVNGVADPQSLFDLKMYACVQHFQNFNMSKAAACEYDLKFLHREFGCTPKIVKKHITTGELNSIIYK